MMKMKPVSYCTYFIVKLRCSKISSGQFFAVRLEKQKKQMVYYGMAPPPIPDIKTSYLDDHCNSVETNNANRSYVKGRNSVDGKMLMQQKTTRSSVSTSGSYEERSDYASVVKHKFLLILQYS